MRALVGLVFGLFTFGTFSHHFPDWTMAFPIVNTIVVGFFFRSLLKLVLIATVIGIAAAYVLHIPFPHF